jgi:radical SAM superfamily enzyme YgiQ (UPF0313 family)
MTNNIILVTPQTDYPNVGILYIANALRQAGYDVHLLYSNMRVRDFGAYLMKLRPLFVGFSVHTYPQLGEIISKSRLTHALRFPVVWGGNHPTCLPLRCVWEEYVDYVITGDGETAVVELANDLMCEKDTGVFIRNGRPIVDLDNYRPEWDMLSLEDYLFPASHSVRGGGNSTERIFYYLATSRGCPWSCTFCYNSRLPKPPWRAHSVDWVRQQVLFLQEELNIDGIGFWDDFFLGNPDRAQRIINWLKVREIKYLCEARASDLNDDFVRWLKATGCLQVFIGGESGSDRILEEINKKITVSDIMSAAELTHKHDLPARFSFIYGFPGETYAEMVETKKLIEYLKLFSNVSISGPKLYTPYPGTVMYQQAIEHGFVAPRRMEDWANINRASDLQYLPWLKEELEKNNTTLEDLDVL